MGLHKVILRRKKLKLNIKPSKIEGVYVYLFLNPMVTVKNMS